MKARLSCDKYETILDLFVVRKSKRSFMRDTLNIQILENVEKIINYTYKHIGGDGCLRACPALAKDLSSVPSFHFE